MNSPDSHIYVGRVDEDCAPSVYAIGPVTVERLEPADDTLRWGVGAADAGLILARVLLIDASGAQPPADVCQRFSDQVISRLPDDGFAIPRAVVSAWLRRVVTV